MMVRTTTKAGYLFCAATIFIVACEPRENQETVADMDENSVSAAHEVHWSYEGDEAPEHWADLSPDFALCRDGTEQSPIDLTDALPIEDTSLERRPGKKVLDVDQRAHVMDLVDNGHTIQITNDALMTIEFGGIDYELIQYHFHAPSEHTIDGEHSPLEVHFVHQSASGVLAVVGALVEEGEHNVIFESVISALPDGPDDPRHLEGLDLDVNELRPMPQHYYRYDGSLTTPPCSEEVKWLIAADRYQISAPQMAGILSHLHHNNRPVQRLGDRVIGLASPD